MKMQDTLSKGAKDYVTCQATVTVHFPIDFSDKAHINCMYCKYYRTSTRRCQLTDEVIGFESKGVGFECPLEIIEEVNTNV